MIAFVRALLVCLAAIVVASSNFELVGGIASKPHSPVFGAAAAAASAADITIDRIRVQLLNETSGTLSKDIVGDQNFQGWNVVAPGDDGREAARDLLVSVVLRSGVPQADIKRPLIVSAKVLKGKLLARRTYRLISTTNGRITAFLFLPDATCSGGIVIEAVYGMEHKSEEVDFDCGE